MKGNISLRGTRERPEQSGVTEMENHADEQCCLFAHICMRKGSAAATSSTSWLVNGWKLETFSSEAGENWSDGDTKVGCVVRISWLGEENILIKEAYSAADTHMDSRGHHGRIFVFILLSSLRSRLLPYIHAIAKPL